MRGKRASMDPFTANNRITPADAGKTGKSKASTLSAWDHPRGCGENLLTYGYNSSNMGSPPRMRGKQDMIHLDSHQIGITPADAGKTAARL